MSDIKITVDSMNGNLLWKKPYKVLPSGKTGAVAHLNYKSSAKVGDFYYQAELEDGSIILIPEQVWKDKYENQADYEYED